MFEVTPSKEAVKKPEGPLIRYYPGSAVEIPNEVLVDGDSLLELANSLFSLTAVDLNPPLPSTHVEYAIAPPNGILQRIGCVADVPCITKHVRDEVVSSWLHGAWRRSSLWLLIRVAIQMTVDRSPLEHASYKRFMLFFMCTLARDKSNIILSSDLLHLMSSTILRRLGKLDPSTPDWLSKMTMEARGCLQEILDARWKELSSRTSPFRNPSQDELIRDTLLTLPNSREYIRNALEDPVHESVRAPFCPSHRHCSSLQDFLSSDGIFFDEAYDTDPDATLCDVERSVEEGIDDWLASATNTDEACARLEALMDRYVMKLDDKIVPIPPENASVLFLTALEPYAALDKLVVKEIPMLADYRPELPVRRLECRTQIHNHQNIYVTMPRNCTVYLRHLRVTHETTLGHQHWFNYLCNYWPALARYPDGSK